MQNAQNTNAQITQLAAQYVQSAQFTAAHNTAHAAQFTAHVAKVLQSDNSVNCNVIGHSVKQNVLKLRYATGTVAARTKVLQKDAVAHSNIVLLQTHNSVVVTQRAALLQFLQAQLNCAATQQTASSMLQQLTVNASVVAAVQQQAATQAACSSANAAAQHLQQIVAQAQQQQTQTSVIVLA
jgi:predicted RNA binding protein with dsRBD fold (UPF0201 family)